MRQPFRFALAERVLLIALVASTSACRPRPSADLDAPEAQPKFRKKRAAKNQNKPTSDERWVDFAIQSEFGCAVERTGAVYCWGRGPDAEMALRELPPQPAADPYSMYGYNATRKWGPPSRIEIVRDARKISAGRSRVCAIVEDGRIRCWGSVNWGGNHVFDVPALRGAVDLDVGDAESCAILEDRSTWCFSSTDFGVPRKRMDDTLALDVNDSLACGLSRSGDIACWGQQVSDTRRYSSQYGPSPAPPTPATPEEAPSDLLEVGRFRGAADLAMVQWNMLCILRTDGKVVCSGRDLYSILRNEDLGMTEVSGLSDVVEVMGGNQHTCARTKGEGVSCWGRNVYGQLGDGSSDFRQTPVAVKGISGARGLSVSDDFSCARTKDDLLCWGVDRGEAIARESIHVHTLPNLQATSISTSQRTTCAVDQNHQLRCWGSDMLESFGILSTSTPAMVPVPMREIAGVASGWESCFLSSDGQLSCGSWNSPGNGAPPTFVTSSSATDVRDLAAGQPPSCTIEGPANKAKLLCGSSVAERKQVIEYKGNPAEVSARNMRACVADDAGSVTCFGFLYYYSGPTPSISMTKIGGVGKATMLASSSYQDCALSRSGKVACWVARTETQWTPDGQPISSTYKADPPKEVTELGDTIVQISAGNSMICALDKAGAVRCWEDNPYAQEGIKWVELPSLEPMAEISAGMDHTCGRHRDGKVTCWGDDMYGQLGRVPSRVYLEATRLPID